MIEEVLIVRHDKVYFGIPTSLIGQILRVPELTPMMLSPKEVRGLCAVGGNIITAVDMNMVLGIDPVDTGSLECRLLSLEGEYSTSALLVSEVLVSTPIEQSKIEYIPNSTDATVAVYHYNEHLIQILDLSKMLVGMGVTKIAIEDVSEKSGSSSEMRTADGNVERYLIFKMGSEKYALVIDNLREILAATGPLTPITGSRSEIAGMMSLRDELLVVADLRKYYGFDSLYSDKNRIVVVQLKEKTIGLIIDEIIDIRDFCDADIDKSSGSDETIGGVIHAGDELISLIGKEMLDRVFTENDAIIVSNHEAQTGSVSDNVMEVVVFKLGKEEYAIDIASVSEIIDMTPVTPIASAPETVDGVINIRGQIVTIGSLHKRLGIPAPETTDQKIIVCEASKGRIGFFVNSVSDVLGVTKDEVRKENHSGDLFSGVLQFNQGKRLVLLFDLNAINLVKGAA